ncbi:MAG: MBL fold metallo-hydrolase [Clostridiales Family XIII bacterium]|nr:MBL fold metallo-hydrolase [Clostridiales Family XIII bacterium]
MSENSMSPYQIIQIAPDAWRIEEEVVRFFLFAGPEKCLVVDTGFGGSNPLIAVQSLTDVPGLLVNTHADGDHTGGNSHFKSAYLHPAEFANYLQSAPDHQALPLWEGDVIDIDSRRFEVILIPGHTPGSIALLDRENRILIAGDSVSDAPVFIFGEARSLPALIASLKKLESMNDEYDVIYPSHGSFPLPKEAVSAQLRAALLLQAGELAGAEPPFEVPALMYVHEGASFLL